MSSLELSNVHVEELCRLAVELVRRRAVQKGLRLELVNATDNRMIFVDERRVRQILLNLLDNAVKFTDPGGAVGLQIRCPDDTHIAFSVWDTGIGIAPDDHDAVFEPFVQVDGGPARRHQGSGLGLALVARLVSLHGGSVELKSELGAGSRFTVLLPVVQ
jgi:signal transduction histidine kinase